MLIVFLCLALWTWPSAVIGAFIPTCGPNTIKDRLHCGDHWTTVVDHYASSAVNRELGCPSAAVVEQADPWSGVVRWTRRADGRRAAVVEQADPWSGVVYWTRRADDCPAAVDHRATDKTVISATAYDRCYGKAARKHIDNDGDTEISTHKFLVFLLIIAITIFLLVYPRFNFVSRSRKLRDNYTYTCTINIE